MFPFHHVSGYLFRADWRYVSETNINAINDNNPQAKEPAWNVLSARFALTFGEARRYSVAVYGENLTDSGYCVGRSEHRLASSSA